MSRAIECDCCGALVRHAHHLRVEELHIPKAGTEDTFESWSAADLCSDCCELPLREILSRAYDGLDLPWDEPENEPA